MANTCYVLDHNTASDSLHGGDYEYAGGMCSWAQTKDDADVVYDGSGRDFMIYSWFPNKPDSDIYSADPYEVKYNYSFGTLDLVKVQIEPDNGEDVSNSLIGDSDVEGSVDVGLGPFSLTLATVDFDDAGDVTFSDDRGSGSWTIARSFTQTFPTAQKDDSHAVRFVLDEQDGDTTKEFHSLSWDSSYIIAYRDTSQDSNPVVSTETAKIQGSDAITTY